MDRLLLESDVIRAIDKHTNDDGELDDGFINIIKNVEAVTWELSPTTLKNQDLALSKSKKEKRVQLFENDNLILEQRGDKYYLSFFDDKGKFRREVTIILKDDYKVTTFNGM